VRAAKRAGLFTVVTPSQWTEGDDFAAADIVLPHLGDRDRPLPVTYASNLGAPWLGLAEIAMRQSAATRAVANGTLADGAAA